MKNDIITFQVCVKRDTKGINSRIFISKSDFDKAKEFGYSISIVDNKEFFVPTSTELYEHHYEVKYFDFPKDAKFEIVSTPFIYNAQPSKTCTKLR